MMPLTLIQKEDQERKVLALVKKLVDREKKSVMMQWRSWDRLQSDILKVIAKNEPIFPTRIMYMAQINTQNTNRELDKLLAQKLIVVDKLSKKVSLTEKGRKLQKLIEKRDKLFSPGLRVNV